MQPGRSLAPLAAALALACGGGGSDEPVTPSLTVEPAEWSVSAGGAPKQFTATLTGASDPLAWAIETAGAEAEVGALSATGLYTPPPSLAAGRDVVLEATAGTLVARATVHVGAAVDGVALTVTPPSGAVVAGSGATVALHAETTHVGTVTWALVPDLGSLDAASGADVTYTAPAALVTATTDVVVTATAGALSDSTTITVRPTVLQVTGPATVRAGGAPVAFVLVTHVGASAVAWSVVPASAGTVSGTASVGTFTPASTVAADTPFQVVATVGEATGGASATLLRPAAAPGSLVGRVVDERGAGYAGAKVVIGAQSATTGADGAFTFASVSPPYDVAVIAESDRTVTVFRGVSDTTPVLPFTRTILAMDRAATISGAVTFEGYGIYARVFGPLDVAWSSGTGGAYTLTTHWAGPSTATVVHRAVYAATDPGSDALTGYLYGARSAQLTDGGTYAGQDISLALLDAGTVAGSVAAEDDHDLTTYGFSIAGHWADAFPATFASWGAADPDVPFGAFELLVPTLPDGAVRLAAHAEGASGGWASASAPVIPGQTGVALVLPSLPVAVAPADGASGVGYGTAFTWESAETGGTDGADVDCDNGVSFRTWGGGRAAALPDLSDHGVTLTPGVTACTWSPRWVSYGMDHLVQGPAAVDALPVERVADGAPRSFTF